MRQPPTQMRNALALAIGAAIIAPVWVSSQGGAQVVRPTFPPDATVIRISPNSRPPRPLAEIPMPVPTDNPITDAKAALGRRLFFDARLSSDQTVSCATCHEPDRAFADERPLAVGVLGRVGKRNSPALINRGYGRVHFWDGRAATLELQVLQPITDPNEMAMTIDDAVARLNADDRYRTEFQQVFGQPISAADVGRALATYLRTIKSGDAPYDRFAAGDQTALSADAAAGLQLFRSVRARCFICHTEPTFSDETFHNTGVAWRVTEGTVGAIQDDGRFTVSNVPRDRGAFKTPTLREVANTAPYMHDGSLATLEDVVEFYNNGGRVNPSLTPLIRPIGLTADEKKALVAFLKSLSGTVSGK